MKSLFSPFWLLSVVGLSLSGCSIFSDSTYTDLQEAAAAQRAVLVERENYRIALAALVAHESEQISDMNIATGPTRYRRPFIGVRVANPR